MKKNDFDLAMDAIKNEFPDVVKFVEKLIKKNEKLVAENQVLRQDNNRLRCAVELYCSFIGGENA